MTLTFTIAVKYRSTVVIGNVFVPSQGPGVSVGSYVFLGEYTVLTPALKQKSAKRPPFLVPINPSAPFAFI
jgi:hypothetical protein